MKIRDYQGGTLGLVAVVTLVIGIIGFGFFFFGKFLGGNRELQNATDAGAINTAKQAAARITVNLRDLSEFGQPPANEFAGLGDLVPGDPQSVDRINLTTYNRAAAKAVWVAINAKAEDTVAATLHANDVLNELRNLGNALSIKLARSNQVNGFFDDLAGPNNIRLVAIGGRTQLIGDVSTAFMRPGARANISFRLEPRLGVGETLSPQDRQNQLENTLPLGITTADISPFESGSSRRSEDNQRVFIAGYRPFNVSSRGGGTNGIVFLPNFPGDRPHLVASAEFNASRISPLGYSPPNAFGTQAQAREEKTSLFERVLSQAIIGVLNKEYTAAIPRGYIRFLNEKRARPIIDGLPPEDELEVDFGNSLANNELWEGTGGSGPILISPESGVFTTGTSPGRDLITQFAAYNNSEGQQPADGLRRNPSIDPLRNFVQGGTPALFQSSPNDPITPLRLGDGTPFGETLRFGYREGQLATVSQVLRIRTFQACNTERLRQPACASNLGNFAGNYNRSIALGRPPAPNGFTALEVLKAKVIATALRVQELNAGDIRGCATIVADPRLVTGVKIYDRSMPYYSPRDPVNFGSEGSIYQTLFFVGSCSVGNQTPNTVYGQIEQRMREVRPGTTRREVLEALNGATSLPLTLGINGRPAKLYLFSPGPGLPLRVSPNLPPEWRINDDENRADGNIQTCTEGPQGVYSKQVNTAATRPYSEYGDCNTRDMPFGRVRQPFVDPKTQDTVFWQPSSGRGNLLGECRFENRATGGGEFCGVN